ncbi:hypothetical protein M413DRAFT_440301 [Hebeloma cylindrosporum]|uniref:CST complex subunit STN1 n=1 Tax=Hebeloma cylindrosporum TaxID=76867 RepID=A0A0C3CD64_HEBCY|nr:hypothetical protein M413DRAFT_440301 [Hebeloma cylindrosporum h7]
MSRTLTSTPERTASKRKTIYLSTPLSPPPAAHVRTRHPMKDIWAWTVTPGAIAACSLKDVLDMEENKLGSYDFFWLGSVPCRIVKVVGMVVGIHVYEKKIIYTIDDGTAVLDCPHALPKPVPTKDTAASKDQKSKTSELPVMPKPIARIGQFIRVEGKVHIVYETRHIIVHNIDVCDSPNDELLHIKAVRALHRTLYSKPEPFVIPPTMPSTPKKTYVPTTPSTRQSSPPSSVSSSPIKPEQITQSPIRLRHPSRLHTKDLTDNTFRIYLKHYMDHAPIGETEYDAETEVEYEEHLDRNLSTPTKRPRKNETPRQEPHQLQHDFTPRPRIPQPIFSPLTTCVASSKPPISSQTDSSRKGFSLSYLRRVPELSLLASRVVHAVTRRRQRAEREREKEAGIPPSKTQKSSSIIPPDKFASKMKRLFQWAVIQLLKEGCIVHWDGPKRVHTNWSRMNTSLLWKANATTSTAGGDSTLFNTTSGSLPTTFAGAGYDDDGMLSDPDPNEEAYIPLTPDFLGDFVEKAIKVLVDHYEEMGKPYTGATKEGVLSVLRKDDRWRYVGEWSIDDSLEFLKQEGRVWALKNGRWDLTA